MTAARRKPARPDGVSDLLSLAARTPGAKVLSVRSEAQQAKKRPGKNKYGAIPTIYDGARYASKAEAAYAVQLDQWKASGDLRGWTRQVPFFLGCPENRYVTDFLLFPADPKAHGGAGVIAVDVKGVRTSKFARDVRLWKRYGPCVLWIVTGGKVVETIVPESIDWARPDAKGGEN